MTTSKSILSYTSAHAFPAKILCHSESLKAMFSPLHLQLNITNKCQLNCPYCSCSDRDRDAVMSAEKAKRIAKKLKDYGAISVTITGGGEPLLSQDFGSIVRIFLGLGIKVALVTNGIAMKRWPISLFKAMTWIRVSFDSYRKSLPKTYDLDNMAYSYVYADGGKESGPFLELIEMAKTNNITHLRIVSDILKSDAAGYKFLGKANINCPNVIIQDRQTYVPGMKDCWISLVKPVIDVDGLIYPCCGAQYAMKNSPNVYNDRLCMGTYKDYCKNHLDKQVPFDGSVCDICYYTQYNIALSAFKMLPSLDHTEFV